MKEIKTNIDIPKLDTQNMITANSNAMRDSTQTPPYATAKRKDAQPPKYCTRRKQAYAIGVPVVLPVSSRPGTPRRFFFFFLGRGTTAGLAP